MQDHLRTLGREAMLAGGYVVLLSLLLPAVGGLLTSPGRLVGVEWMLAALAVAVFGVCLIAIGYGLLLLVCVSSVLAHKYARWRHNRVWRQRS